MEYCENKCRSKDHCVGFSMQLGQCTLKSMDAPTHATIYSRSSVNLMSGTTNGKLNTQV